ncbi:MAG: HlyD family efflux transporter periplasmic adaptor subunit, partial [Anaerolineales bacterium]|nr:HlyD family efflux transporter periplasmic adaptor subunit [Anaerolineales bacterium]
MTKLQPRVLTMLILVTLVVALVACAGGGVPPAPTPPAAEEEVQPTAEPVPEGRTVAADGRLESPYPELTLSFGGGASGRVLAIAVHAGETVEVGQLLAELDDSELRRAVEEAELKLERALEDLDQAEAGREDDLAKAEKARADAERALTSARLGYSDTDLEQARTNLDRARQAETDAKDTYERIRVNWPPVPIEGYYDSWQRAIRERELAEMRLADAGDAHSADWVDVQAREADLAEAERALVVLRTGADPTHERAVEDARVELASAQDAVARAELVAPWPALVLSVEVAPQATVEATTPIVTLLNLQDGLRFSSANLSEQHIADVYPGEPAVVTLRTYPEMPLEGVVEAVVPQTEEATEGEARFTIHVRLAEGAGAELRLLPGLTGRVEIVTK